MSRTIERWKNPPLGQPFHSTVQPHVARSCMKLGDFLSEVVVQMVSTYQFKKRPPGVKVGNYCLRRERLPILQEHTVHLSVVDQDPLDVCLCAEVYPRL